MHAKDEPPTAFQPKGPQTADLFNHTPEIITAPFACRRCRSRQFTVQPGVGPHAKQLRCAQCNLGGYWMPKDVAREREG